MSDAFSPDGPKLLLDDLCRLVADRREVEEKSRADLASQREAAENESREAERAAAERHGAEKAAVEAEYAAAREETEEKYRAERGALEKEYESVRAEIEERFAAESLTAQQKLQDSHWQAIESSDAARGGLNVTLQELVEGLETRWKQLEELHQQAAVVLHERGYWDDVPPAEAASVVLEKHPGRRFCHAVEKSQALCRELAEQRLPRWFQGSRPLAVFFLLWALAAVPTIVFLRPTGWRWALAAPISCAAATLIALIFGGWAYRVAKRRSVEKYLDLRRTLLEAGLGNPSVLETAKEDCRKLDAAIIARHKEQTRQADGEFAAASDEIQRRRDDEIRRVENTYPKKLADLEAWRNNAICEIEEKYPSRLERMEAEYRSELQRARGERDRALEESERLFRQRWDEMCERWREGIERFRRAIEESDRRGREAFPDWNGDDWRHWSPSEEIPAAIPLGRAEVKLSDLEGGVPEDERLRPERTEFALPIALPFPRRSLLLLKVDGPGRGAAVDLMQSTMLRMLSAMPPSKVCFTIVDPVGLGENFSAFMHLADFDEQLVSSRIWTDPAHVEQRLADLTKHMENVIQVYLRKEFQSIEEYNAFAGEMAEPYRVLAIANFPANFTEAAAQRLKSIVASGARCGVFTILSVDAKAALPRNFQLADLKSEALVLSWKEGRFVWKHPEFGHLTVDFPAPPPVERFKQIVRAVGAAARDSGRVEVPFSCIVPEENDYWTADGRAGIDVPLGRAGAMKLQHLNLGSGTSQHVLISGKTGSGKSTLLHVLITNLALRYAPHEVELYLIDFKKGVEFKAYSRAALPHARVVAIESEREFGLSVLQRLDAELRTRGDMFRRRGLQDLKSYRAADPEARLPRILLIIDEFQELFTEDDRIAQESALLLDRLVRQGRAFGIHVMLGSQTLGGAYTLARSTIGQMAVRIALQCSESDAHLILSEDNTAARLLTRPGEAIYNDANGLYEGNHPFQIVWLPDNERDDYLERIVELQKRRKVAAPPQIVFEGNVLADLENNEGLRELLTADAWPADITAPRAWLGSAVAIKEPTSAPFLRQHGGNLLMVGHREEAALGVLSGCLVSLVAQHHPAGAKFYILDGMRADAPEAGFWKRLAAVMPHEATIGGVKDAPKFIGELYAELASRRTSESEDAPPIYLFLYNLGRFRELRKDDEFGFSSSDEEPTAPSKQFAALLDDGPPLGIHTLVWCDTYANVSRILDRRVMQDFELRVLFQMNANDSSSLMDSPEAAKLGVYRAILYDEGQGLAEKFRPYGLPRAEYLAWLKKRLRDRT
ncbi:MAG: AAA family ATPase [Pirellulales bacterium]|nr:AAA family ATPase [Pirellulales bacterium]